MVGKVLLGRERNELQPVNVAVIIIESEDG
jgi:hypothetical protein